MAGVRRGCRWNASVPVYEDAPEFEDIKIVIEDKDRRKILN